MDKDFIGILFRKRFVEGVLGGSISLFATLLYHKGKQKGLFIGIDPEQKSL